MPDEDVIDVEPCGCMYRQIGSGLFGYFPCAWHDAVQRSEMSALQERRYAAAGLDYHADQVKADA